MTIWITTNGRPSNGAKELGQQPGFRRAKEGGAILPTDTVINWGSSSLAFKHPYLLNNPYNVGMAANKLKAFSVMSDHGVKTVDWSGGQVVPLAWANTGATVVARTKLTGHSGDGIIIVEPGYPLPPAPLYTKYVFKEKEFRVHVVLGSAVDTQRKVKDPNRAVVTWKVRSHENGFIYVRENIANDPARDALAVTAVAALGLDFGAVDIIQDKKGAYYVLEVNTAPGITGQTVENYAKAFQNGGV